MRYCSAENTPLALGVSGTAAAVGGDATVSAVASAQPGRLRLVQ